MIPGVNRKTGEFSSSIIFLHCLGLRYVLSQFTSSTDKRISWSTVSKAALRSIVVNAVTHLFSVDHKMSFMNLFNAVSQLLYIYTDCYSGIRLYFSHCVLNCCRIPFSSALTEKKDLPTG